MIYGPMFQYTRNINPQQINSQAFLQAVQIAKSIGLTTNRKNFPQFDLQEKGYFYQKIKSNDMKFLSNRVKQASLDKQQDKIHFAEYHNFFNDASYNQTANYNFLNYSEQNYHRNFNNYRHWGNTSSSFVIMNQNQKKKNNQKRFRFQTALNLLSTSNNKNGEYEGDLMITLDSNIQGQRNIRTTPAKTQKNSLNISRRRNNGTKMSFSDIQQASPRKMNLNISQTMSRPKTSLILHQNPKSFQNTILFQNQFSSQNDQNYRIAQRNIRTARMSRISSKLKNKILENNKHLKLIKQNIKQKTAILETISNDLIIQGSNYIEKQKSKQKSKYKMQKKYYRKPFSLNNKSLQLKPQKYNKLKIKNQCPQKNLLNILIQKKKTKKNQKILFNNKQNRFQFKNPVNSFQIKNGVNQFYKDY